MRTYVTLLSESSYVKGVLKLYRSMQKVGCKYPLLCVCSKDIPPQDIQILLKKSILVHVLDDRIDYNAQLLQNEHEFSHWKFTFDKLQIWGLTQYEKLVFLDADMMLLSSIDELFNCPSLSAVQAGRELNPDWIRLNSGCMVLVPSVEVKGKMLSLIENTIRMRSVKGYSTGDQDVINAVYPNWSDMKHLHLSEGYNLFFGCLDVYIKHYGYGYGEAYKGKQIKIVHFVGKTKPWEYSLFTKIYMLCKCALKRRNSFYVLLAYLRL